MYDQYPQIGTAWTGQHVVLVQCNMRDNRFITLYKSIGAPEEPPHSTCAETLSRFFSIGYKLAGAFPISFNEVQYILVSP
ncbi:MAG: hypothetical protein ACO1OC_10035 [Tuberibacillus sp.]